MRACSYNTRVTIDYELYSAMPVHTPVSHSHSIAAHAPMLGWLSCSRNHDSRMTSLKELLLTSTRLTTQLRWGGHGEPLLPAHSGAVSYLMRKAAPKNPW